MNKIKIPLKPRITIQYLLNLIENAELSEQDVRDITNTIDLILEIEDANNIDYDYIHQKILELTL